jgi:hypothetical protein
VTTTERPERYLRAPNARGLNVITRADGEPLGAPRLRSPELEEALAHLRAAAEALRKPPPDTRRWFPTPPRPQQARPPELQGIDGEALRRARAVARLSQRDLAVELGQSRGVLADAERGRRSVPERVAWWVYRVLCADGGPTDGEAGR